jgi:hypothetical protein
MSGMAQIAVSLATWKAIEAQRLSFSEDHDAIIRRALSSRRHQAKQTARILAQPALPTQRKRGSVSVKVAGRDTPVANLKDAYITILSQLVKIRPSLFQMLLKEGSNRRRWIGLTEEALFPFSPHLARQHAHQIAPNWYVDTNVSKAQIEARLAKAAELAGHVYGQDVLIVGV